MEEQAVDLADCIAVEDTVENSASKISLWSFGTSVTYHNLKFFTQAALIFLIVVS